MLAFRKTSFFLVDCRKQANVFNLDKKTFFYEVLS